MHSTKRLIIAAALLGLGGACNRSPSETREDAIEAQTKANKEINAAQRDQAVQTAEAREKATKEAAEARQQHDDAIAEQNKQIEKAREEARDKVANAQAKADDKIANANEKVDDGNQNLHDWGTKKLDALNASIDDVRQKANDAKPAVRAQVNASLHDVSVERDKVANELATTHPQSPQKAEQVKAALDQRIARLESRVDALRKRL